MARKKLKVYISGPMTGIKLFNRPEFHDTAERLRSRGHSVMNPACLGDGFTQAEYMQVDMAMLLCCDSIYLLKGWDRSMGACAEVALAKKLGFKVIEEF